MNFNEKISVLTNANFVDLLLGCNVYFIVVDICICWDFGESSKNLEQGRYAHSRRQKYLNKSFNFATAVSTNWIEP